MDKSLYMLLPLLILGGCSEKNAVMESGSVSGAETCVSFRIMSPPASSRSMVTADEDRIENLNVYVYGDGVLEGELYADGDSPGTLRLMSGRSYRFYTLANVGKVSAPLKESDIKGYRHRLADLSDIADGGLPMASVNETVVSGKETVVNVELVRLVAKVYFRLESGDVPGLEVKSIRLVNSPSDMTPFSESSAAESVMSGDYASPSDIKAVNSGESAYFYMLENCQGVLLPDNDDQWQKVPDMLPDPKAGLCTYMEVTAILDGTSGMTGPVTYRFYLGQDSTSDFNIYRNTENTVTLVTSMDGLEKFSWRIDTSSLISNFVPVVVVGANGLIAYTDRFGRTIRKTVGQANRSWNAVAYGNGKYIAVGTKGGYIAPPSPGNIAVSSDLSNWTAKPVVSYNMTYHDIYYGRGTFFALGTVTFPNAYLDLSQDGQQWRVVIPKSGSCTCITYGKEFVLLGPKGSISVSPDGEAWFNLTDGTKDFLDVCYGNGIYVCLRSSTDKTYGSIGYSEYPKNKFTYIATGGIIYRCIAYGNGKFVAVGNNGKVACSSDGIVWEHSSAPELSGFQPMDICFGNSRFVAVGNNGKLFYSVNGTGWIQQETGIEENLYGVCVIP